MARVVVIGAGAMGLAAAHRAAVLGHAVEVIEADAEPGGMAAHQQVAGLSIERFYHFVCGADEPTFALMRELGIADRLRWRPTSMGYYMKGEVHRWGDPLALLRFPHLGLADKLRTGVQMFGATRARDFAAIEQLTARQWLERGSGEAVYRILWERLMRLKFHELADEISASWIATRVRRLGTSRRSLFQEELGYIDGGSQLLVDALVESIRHHGGRIHLAAPALRVTTAQGRVTGIEARGLNLAADAVISTVPTPLIPTLVPDLPEGLKARYAAIRNIGVVCLLFLLKRPVSPHFWINVSEEGIEIPGLVEFSNLRPLTAHAVYVPYYMPASHPKWGWPDEDLIAEAFGYLRRINPALQESDLIAARANRLRHAQPVCEPGFRDRLPPVRTPIAGLFAADTCFYYPEDRGIAESVRLGRGMAEMIAP